jgi:hypothetical protein
VYLERKKWENGRMVIVIFYFDVSQFIQEGDNTFSRKISKNLLPLVS